MTLTELARLRLHNQQFVNPEIKSGPAMIKWFGAMQGQEYAQTKWGLGLRVSQLCDDNIETDFAAGKILRTHILRPTWHFISDKDIRWLLTLTAPRVHLANAYMYRQLELDQKVFNKCHDLLTKLLQGGKQLTRDEINQEFEKHKIIAAGHRLSYIMMHAELEGIICSGARRGNQFTYARLDERVAHNKTLTPDESLHELTKRYFMSKGPATVKDFATWSGLKLTECRKGVEMLKPKLKTVVIEGSEYYFKDPVSSLNESIENIYLLPIYDEFIMGYKDREAFFEFKNSAKAPANFQYDNMIMMDGQIIGTWRRAVKPALITVAFQFFKPLNKKRKELLDKAVQRLSAFTQQKVEIVIS